MDQIDGSFRALWYTSHYLIFVNAAINPLLYGITNDNFRRAYHQTPWFPCQFQPKVEKVRTNIFFMGLNYSKKSHFDLYREQKSFHQ